MDTLYGIMWLLGAVMMGVAAVFVVDSVETVRQRRQQDPHSFSRSFEFVGYALTVLCVAVALWNLSVALSYWS